MRLGAGIDLPALAMRMSSSLWDYNLTGGTLPPVLSVARGSTGTRVNNVGLIVVEAANTPRFDYEPVTHVCRGLLVEEQATYFGQYSEQVGTAPWALTNALSVTGVAADSPLRAGDTVERLGGGSATGSSAQISGVPTANALVQHWMVRNVSAITSQIIYRDTVSSTQVAVTISWASATAGAEITSVTPAAAAGGITCVTAQKTQFTGGWWLVTAVYTVTALASAHLLRLQPSNNPVGGSCDVAASWGTYSNSPQSYLLTTTMPVTRDADVLNILDTSRAVELTYVPLSGGSPQTVIIAAGNQPGALAGIFTRARQLL